VPEYAKLRNATLLSRSSVPLAAGEWTEALPLPGTAVSTSEIQVTVPLQAGACVGVAKFGVAVLAPNSTDTLGSAATVWLTVGSPATAADLQAPDGALRALGSRRATLSLVNSHSPPLGLSATTVSSQFTVNAGETAVSLQIYVDRVVIEAFANGGRAEVVAEEYAPGNTTAVHLYSEHSTRLANLSVHGMGCGWA